ncbi:ABC transporter permease subunit [Halopenitus persicus]|uniref:ABC-2 family transporter protein n=1 Tax=Halopenitus persicus TaxID=1048396 RepID=A0A1H3H1P6_9EURY|nr:ABC transporter permease subunit [Halopenitus persicus]QHS16164.1 ABC transporter permease subunit [haloarchaeon 3A1-DGR]SDY08694.1 ABC-2 family transporter protein [Halopenitus persicus]
MALPRWFPLARAEARRLLTSNGPWILAILLVLWAYRPSYVGWDELGPNLTVGFIQIAGSILLPLGVLLLSYRSVVAERSSGSLKFLLGLPLTRTDILVAKTLGRSAGIAIPVIGAVAVLGLAGGLRFGLFSPLRFGAVLLVTLLYVVTLVSIATAVSAATTSTVRATGVLFGGFYLVLTVLWKPVATAIYGAATGRAVSAYDAPADGALFLLLRMSPERSYHIVTNWLLGVGNSGALFEPALTKLRTPTSINVYAVDAAFEPGSVPLYLHELSGLLVLLCWLIVPLGVARYRFERGDLV